MATVNLILPLEAMTVNNPIDIRSNSRSSIRGDSREKTGVKAAAAEQQGSESGLITERHQEQHWSDIRATAGVKAKRQQERYQERQSSGSRSDSSGRGATEAAAEQQRSDSRSDSGETEGETAGATA